MLKKSLRFLAVLVTMAAILLGMGVTAYAASDTPTRTTPIDLTKITAAEDHIEDEGWAWEPSENGGTLTLQNLYLKAEHKGNGLIFGNGEIVIQLVGDNTVETTSDLFQPLIFGSDVAWTVRGSENGGKLTLKMPDSTNTYLPYGFAGKKLTIESGEIHSEMVLAMPYRFEMSGGSVTIDKGTGSSAAIQALMGDVYLTGGKIRISGSVCGIAATWDSTELVVDGADVSINATVVALSAKKITYKNGNLDITGGTRATNVPIQTTIPGTGTMTDGTANQPYDPAAYKNFVSFVAKHSHEGQPGVWESDEEKHWSICDCGVAMQSEAHQYTQKHDAENHWQECVCGKQKDVEAHTFGEWVTTKDATQTEAGQEMRKCSACGYEETKEIAKLPAAEEPTENTRPTDPGADTRPVSPKTGDSTSVAAYAAMMVLCGAAMLLVWRKQVKASKK